MPYIGNITQDFNVNNAMLDTDSVTSIKIVDGTIEGADIAANLDLSDSQRIRFGAGNDLQIYHDGSNSYVDDLAGTGALRLRTNQIELLNNSGDEKYFIGITNQQVELYYDNSKKFETTSAGATVTGALATTSLSATGGITGTGGNFILGDSSGTSNNRIKLGASGDLQIYHDGSNSVISEQGTGDLTVNATSLNLYNNDIGGAYATFASNGAVELFHAGAKKFETTSTGVSVTGGITADGTSEFTANVKFDGGTAGRDITFLRSSNKLRFQDNTTFSLGDDDDFSAFHDGSKTRFINDTGNLELQSDNYIFRDKDNGDLMMKLLHDGAVELYYDHVKKLETTSLGVQLTDGHIFLNDNYYVSYGTGNDLLIYHDGTYNRIAANAQIFLQNKAANETYLAAYENGTVELYFDNSNKFETRSNGVEVNGHLHLGDSNEIRLGNVGSNGDLRLVHDGSNSRIRNLTGQLQLRSDTIALENNDGSNYAAITGLRLLDNAIARFGSSNDLQIYHDGSNSVIADVGTGALVIKSNQIDFIDSTSTEFLARFFENSAIELYFDSNKKFETTSTGTLNTGVSKFITGNGSTASDDNVVHIVAGSTADRGIMIGTGRSSGASQNDGMGYIDAINSESNGYGSQLQFRIDGTAVMTIGYNSNDYVGIGTTLPNKLLHVDTNISNSNHFIAEFTGANSTNAAACNFYYMLCGSNDNRTGLYWEHQNVSNVRMWMDDSSNLRQSSSDPTAHNSGTAFSYAGGSDYRLKENVVNYTNGITELKQLKAYKFNYIDTDRTIVDKPDVLCSGFYAHEAGEVVPASLIGEKDEVDFEGNPVYQSLKYEKFVPLLTAALQEAVAKIETLEAKVAALEAA